jgi:hypothetical protein
MARRRTGGRFARARRAVPRRARVAYRRGRRRGGPLTGKGMLNNVVGALGILAMKKVIGENSMVGVDVGSYNPPVQKIGAGMALRAIGMDNTDLVSAGLKEGIATVIDNYTSGRGLGIAKGRGPLVTSYGEVAL